MTRVFSRCISIVCIEKLRFNVAFLENNNLFIQNFGLSNEYICRRAVTEILESYSEPKLSVAICIGQYPCFNLLSLAGVYGTLGVLTNLIKVQAIGLTMDCKITTNIHL